MAHVLGQTWEREVLAQGRAIGKTEGKAEASRALLMRIGRKRWGEPAASTVTALDAIRDLERLERMSDSILDVSGWAELLATP